MSKFNEGDRVRINTPGESGDNLPGVIREVYPEDGMDYSVDGPDWQGWLYREEELEPWEEEPEPAMTPDELKYLRYRAMMHGVSGHTKADRLITKIIDEYEKLTQKGA